MAVLPWSRVRLTDLAAVLSTTICTITALCCLMFPITLVRPWYLYDPTRRLLRLPLCPLPLPRNLCSLLLRRPQCAARLNDFWFASPGPIATLVGYLDFPFPSLLSTSQSFTSCPLAFRCVVKTALGIRKMSGNVTYAAKLACFDKSPSFIASKYSQRRNFKRLGLNLNTRFPDLLVHQSSLVHITTIRNLHASCPRC